LVFIDCLIKVKHSKKATFVDWHYLCPQVEVYCVGSDFSQWVRASLQNVVFLECCQTMVDINCCSMVVMVVAVAAVMVIIVIIIVLSFKLNFRMM
jgi:hypothetical protein